MRTLIQPIALWLAQGQQPRTFVRITDNATPTPNEILFSGTQAQETALDDIESFGNISKNIRHEGGASKASGASVKNLILSNRLPLCTEPELSTFQESYGGITYIGAARLLSWGATGVSYADVRNAVTAEFAEVALVVGRSYNAGSNYFSVYRSILQFSIPAMTTCEDAYIKLTGLGLYSASNFYIGILEGTWADMSNPSGLFNDFTGWATSGDYNVTLFNNAWYMAEYGAICRIRFNDIGRAAVLAKQGGILRIVLISQYDLDSDVADPAGQEFVQFKNDATLNIRYNSYTLENKNIAIYYGVAPLPASYTLMDKMYTGVVDRYEINDRNLDIESRQNDFKKNKVIPSTIITTDNYPLAHESVIGKAIPIVYGNFQTTRLHRKGIPNSVNQNNAVEYGLQDMIKTYIYEKYSSGASNAFFKVIIANHAIKTIGNTVAIYEDNIKEFTQIIGDITAIIGMGNAKIQIDRNVPGATQFPYDLTGNTIQPFCGFIPLHYSEFMAEPNTAENCINENISDYTTFLPNDSCYYYLNMYFPREAYGIIELYRNRYLCFKTVADAGYDIYFKYTITYYDYNNTIHAGTPTVINTDGWHYIDITTLPDQDILSYYFTFSNVGGAKTIKLYNVAFFVGYRKNITGELFISVQGAYYGSWIDAAGRSNSFNENDLIENPSHVIESIARDEMGIVTAEIDTASFDMAATALNVLATMKFAFQILEQRKGMDILNDLAFQSRLYLFWDSNDKLKVKLFNSAAYFPNSGTNIPGLMDMFTITGLPVSNSFTTHQILSGPDISKMKIDEVKNDFILHYNYNYGLKQYTKTLHVNKDEENLDETICAALGTTGAAMKLLCTNSYAAIGAVNTFEYDCWAIRDETTATALIKHLIERLSVMRWILDFEAGNSAIIFEEGDFINVRDDLLDARFGTAVMNVKKWMVINIDSNPGNHNVKLRVIEV